MPKLSKPFILALTGFALLASAAGWMLFFSPDSSPVASSRAPVAHTARTPGAQESLNAAARTSDRTTLTQLELSRPPTTAELIAAGSLGEPLIPSAAPSVPADNLAFGRAIQAWNQHRFDTANDLFTQHLKAYPASPWAAETQLHLATHCQNRSRYTEAAAWLDAVLTTTPKDSRLWQKARYSRATLHLAQHELIAAARDFAQIHRDDPDPRHRSYASYWLREISLRKDRETVMNFAGPLYCSNLLPVTTTIGTTPLPLFPADLGSDPCADCYCGMPGWSINQVNFNFRIADTPMWWDAPYGPSVYLTLHYNSLDSLTTITPFGDKWSFAYASWLVLGESGDDLTADVRDGDGHMERFTVPAAATTFPRTYTAPAGDTRTLVETADHVFALIQQNGSTYHYAVPAAMAGTSSVPFLTSIADRHANTLTITHNSAGAILTLHHSALPTADHWTFHYTAIVLPDGVTTVNRVQRIEDPFARETTFGYDADANLTNQSDMGGLAYSYQYTTSGELFITSLQTPKGTTTFATEPADGGTLTEELIGGTHLARGYHPGYPPIGFTPMGENYRIRITHADTTVEEYHYDSLSQAGYHRDPVQLAAGVDPAATPASAARYTLVGDRGRVTAINLGGIARYSEAAHDPLNRLPTETTDTLGTIWKQYYQTGAAQGQLEFIRLPKSDNEPATDYEIRFAWDTNGKDLLNVKRNLGGVEKTLASYTYQTNRDPHTLTDANGRTLTCTWHGNGLPDTITDSLTSDVITFTYDTNWRPGGLKINNQPLATTAYDLKGRLLSVLSPSGYQTFYDYDNLNRLKREDHPDGSFIEHIWQCCFTSETRSGKTTGGQDRILQRTVFGHDARGRLTNSLDTAGHLTRYQYDPSGRLTHLIDPANNDTEWKYDALGRLDRKIYPDTTEEIYQWTDDTPTTFTNRRNQDTTFHYDSHRNLDLTTSPEAADQTVFDTWDRPGELWHTPTGGTVQKHILQRDLLDRITELDGPWADDTIAWQYQDAQRKVIRTTPGNITTETTADAFGRLATLLNPLGLFTHAYEDNSAQLNTITHTGGNANSTAYAGFDTALTYHGDTLRRALHTLTAKRPGGDTIATHTYDYDAQGRITTWQREPNLANPAGTTRSFTWNLQHDFNSQLTDVLESATPTSAVQSTYHYAYDPAGNLRSAQQSPAANQPISVNTRSHNNLNQVTGLSGGGTTLIRGTLDEPGDVAVGLSGESDRPAKMINATTFEAELDLAPGTHTINVTPQDGNGNRSHYTYDIEVATEAARTFSYDDDGNLLSDGLRTYEWDSRSRLTQITWATGKTTSFTYNARGQRATRTETDGTTTTVHHYLYDGITLIDRRTGTDPDTATIDRRYFPQGEQRLEGQTWTNYHYTRDHLGSIREVVKWDGTLAARYDYTPYGQRQTQYQATSYADGCERGFTGHITLPSLVTGQPELVLAHYRAYDPELGRWLSADPIREEGGINLYAYVRGRPVMGVDKLGASDTWFGIEGEAMTPFGGLGFGVGWTQDEDHPEESGLSFTIGFGMGVSLGVGAGVVYWDDECEGLTKEIDVNIGPVSPIMPFPDEPGAGPMNDAVGHGITVGLGAGISCADNHTGTISIAMAKDIGKGICDGASELGKSIGKGLETISDTVAGWFD